MNLPLVIVAPYVALLCGLVYRRSAWLFAIWTACPIVFPTMRYLVASAPIYLYDMSSVAVLALCLREGLLNKYPRSLPKWHIWLVALGLTAGTILPILKYGAPAAAIYLFLERCISWLVFLVAVIIGQYGENGPANRAMRYGILTSAICLVALAVVQWGNPSANELVQKFYYRDSKMVDVFGSHAGPVDRKAQLRMEHGVERVRAPFWSTTLAGMAAMVGVANLFMFRRSRSFMLQYGGLACCTMTILLTGSRHGVLAVGCGVAAAVVLGNARIAVRTGVITVILGIIVLHSEYSSMWEKRLEATQRGVFSDESIRARLIYGPERLFQLITLKPEVFWAGTGIDASKLAKHGGDVDRLTLLGRLSNGFLLYIYTLGIFGFLVFLGFWLWTFRIAWSTPDPQARQLGVAAVVTTMVVIVSDNYSVYEEPAVWLQFLVAGTVVAARLSLTKVQRLAAGQRAPDRRLLNPKSPLPA